MGKNLNPPNDQLALWAEGEKIPDTEIIRVFRKPPGIPDVFGRSALIVGSKGAGKTTLLRYQKEKHSRGGIAIHVSLATELASIPKQAGLGPLSLHAAPRDEDLLINKIVSLLAVGLAARLCRKHVRIPLDVLHECIPTSLYGKRPKNSLDWLTDLKVRVSRGPLVEFASVAASRPLVTFLEATAEGCHKKHGPLLLLLDRADLVTPLALVPVLEVLDQSPGYTALVATRPGHGGATLNRLEAAAGPADQYDVHHLGLWPRSHEWVDFVCEAIEAQLGAGSTGQHGPEIREGVLALARDSIRTGLEAFARLKVAKASKVRDELNSALNDLKELQIVAVQSKVLAHHGDFRKLINTVRKRVNEEGPTLAGPVEVSVNSGGERGLFGPPPQLALFIESALRAGGLSMCEGKRWLPGLLPDTLEVPPLLLWEPGDPMWRSEGQPPPKPFVFSDKEFLSTGGGPSPRPNIFIAYRMNSDESKAFRFTIEEDIGKHHTLGRCQVIDGRVPVGVDWAPEIRGRIKKAKLVVGDCTALRPEVLFELGFAHGLNTAILPVVSRMEKEELPYWLRAKQIGQYSDSLGMSDILASIEAHLVDPSYLARRLQKPPVPSLVVWLRRLDWNRNASEQFHTAARREELKVEFFDEEDSIDEVLSRASIATFLVVSLDGREWDDLSHFICGAVVAKPNAGYGSKKIPRKIVVIEPDDVQRYAFCAEGLSRCVETVLICKPDEVLNELTAFSRSKRVWSDEVQPQDDN
jgi:hypothetical protein